MKSAAVARLVPLPTLIHLLRRYGVDRGYRRRALMRVAGTALLEPLRWYERLRFGKQIAATTVHPSPVFILGSGRSGTTHLHNLTWQDPQFGVISNLQALTQSVALTGAGWMERLAAGRLPETRPMDNVAVTLDAPQEDGVAMLNATKHAAFHFLEFPGALPHAHDDYVADLRQDPERLEAWKNAYMDVLRKTTMLCGGKRLALKTPPNTARITTLLELFPEAKFVHLVRNPYRVFPSMLKMYRTVIPDQTYHEVDWDRIRQFAIESYQVSMKRYLEDRATIPEGQLIEIRYEDLDERPLEILEQIYVELDLGDFVRVRPHFEDYLDSLGGYQKNTFPPDPEVIATVNEHWGLTFEAFGYDLQSFS